MRLHAAATAPDQQTELAIAHRAIDLVTGAGDDFCADPALEQRGLHRDGDVQKGLIGQHPQRGVEAVRITRFSQQCARARHIEPVTGIGQRGGHASLNRALMQLAIAGHQAFIDALIIDQIAYRLPHFDIVEVRIFHAHRQVVDRSFSYRINGEVGVVPQGAHVGDRHVTGDIQIAFLHHQPQGLRLLQMAEHHPRHLRLAAPVISRTTHAQHIFCLPYIQPERAGARFMGGEPAVAQSPSTSCCCTVLLSSTTMLPSAASE